MTTRNFSVPMLNMDNKPILLVDEDRKPMLDDDGKQRMMMLADIVENVLHATLEGDKELTGPERTGLISCAIRVHEGGPREYKPEELVTIKKRSEKAGLSHLQYYRLSEVIDAPDAPAEPTKTE